MGFAIYLLFDPVSVFQHRSGIFSFKVIIMQNDSGFIFCLSLQNPLNKL